MGVNIMPHNRGSHWRLSPWCLPSHMALPIGSAQQHQAAFLSYQAAVPSSSAKLLAASCAHSLKELMQHALVTFTCPRRGERARLCSATTEKELFGGLWLPSLLAGTYAWTLYRWSLEMRATQASGIDPFKATAVWPSAVFTVIYLASLYFGKKLMASRQPFSCKNYMFVYNLYQVWPS